MNNTINNGKGFLKEKLGGYQADPPDSVWNTISARMGGRNRRGMVIIVMAAAASVALAVTLGIHYFGPDVPGDSPIAETQDRVPDIPEKASPAIAKSQSPEKVSLEEKVVSVMNEEEEFPFDIATPSISEVIANNRIGAISAENDVRTAEQVDAVYSTETSIEEDLAENKTFEDEILTLDAGDAAVGDELGENMISVERERDLKWMLGASLSPLYTFRDAEAQYVNSSPDYESGMVSYAGGVQIGYRTTRRLAIESGIFYNKMGIDIGAPGIQLFSNDLDFAPIAGAEGERSNVLAISNTVGNIVSESGDIYVNSYKLNASYESSSPTDLLSGSVNAEQGIRQHLDYLELPFNLRYTIVDRRFKLHLVGGVSTNLLVNNYVTMESADGPIEIGYLTNIKNVNYSGNAGIGLSYHFLDHFSLNLEPRFRYYLNSVNDATLPSTRPYTFGLYTGLNYFF